MFEYLINVRVFTFWLDENISIIVLMDLIKFISVLLFSVAVSLESHLFLTIFLKLYEVI